MPAGMRGQSPQISIMRRSEAEYSRQGEQQRLRKKKEREREPANLSQQVQGVNASVEHFAVAVTGTNGGSLWDLNLSALPGQQRRLLSITGLSTFLVNYAQQSYPARLDLLCQGVSGCSDASGNTTEIIATMVPSGPAIPVYNSGGVIGFNLHYSLLGQAKTFDISHMPNLVFNLRIGAQGTPATYPLSQSIVIDSQVTHVIL